MESANTNCSYCDKPIYRKPGRPSKTGYYFCSKSHQSAAAKDPNFVYKTGPTPLPSSLSVRERCACGRRNRRHESKPTCQRCEIEERRQRWLNGDNSASWSGINRDPYPFVKKTLIELRGDKCEKCGWDEKSPDDKSIIQMDHIDGDYLNNSLNNLQLLCPNHHAMTSTYGSKNRGSGRAYRRKV